MPGQLLPIRLLGSSAASRAASIVFTRFRSRSFSQNHRFLRSPWSVLRARDFSFRAARSRDHRRCELRAGAAAGQGRSLIDDEAELSDWVSDLKTDSLRLGLSSDDDENSGRDRVQRSSGSTGRGRGRTSPSSVRSRPSSIGVRDSLKKKRFDSDLEEDEEDDEEGGFLGRVGTERGRRAGVSSSLSRKGRRDVEPSYSKVGRATRSVLATSEEELDEDDEEGGFLGRVGTERGGRVGVSSSATRKGRRDVEPSYSKVGRVKSSVLAMSPEELDEDESDEDVISDFDERFFSDGEDRKEKVAKSPFAKVSSPESAEGESAQLAPRILTGGSDSYLSQTRFDQCSISPLSLKGIQAAGYERMTVVQEATLPVILKGKDVLAKAKTGTGKTVAFLLPAIEVVVKLPPVDRDQRRPPINVLVICPTRELASQAAAEANTLLKYHPSIGVQVVIGGTRLALEQKRMQTNACQFLVATPGRLKDHIENTPGFATRLMGVKVLVLDEADRLLDMGFRKDIEKIVAAVPKQRQTLLFSATVPDEVRQICYIAMRRDHEFVNTVEEGSEETHSQVRQMHLLAPLDNHFSMLYAILTEHISEDADYKVIVFCTTAMFTKFVADLLAELHLNVREIHSRKPQSYRTRVSKEFKESKGLILVSSDVSARGVDYPDVTLVVQLGVPADRQQYIHRLGRTGRKGKEGKGILMLAPWEDFFLTSIKDLPVTKASIPAMDPDTRKKVERALAHVDMKSKESAYQAWLGYYNSNKNVGRDKSYLVALANEFSRSMGLDNPPAIAKLVLRKMGLNNVPGLRAK